MVLLDHDTLQRMDFPHKKAAYRASGKRLAQEVASYDQWTLASVNKYQMWLAHEAVKTWRIDWAREEGEPTVLGTRTAVRLTFFEHAIVRVS